MDEGMGEIVSLRPTVKKNEHAKFNVRAIVDDLYYPAVRGIGRPSLTGKLRTRRLKWKVVFDIKLTYLCTRID